LAYTFLSIEKVFHKYNMDDPSLMVTAFKKVKICDH